MTIYLYLSLLCIVFPASLSQQEPPNEGRERCNSFVSNYQKLRETFEEHSFRVNLTVDPENGSDNASCLNGSHSCRSITYALYGYHPDNTSNSTLRVELHDIKVILLPGNHTLTAVARIVNSSFVYIHGVDASTTIVRCAKFPNADLPCVFDNLEIMNSNFTFIRDLTITQCGPIPVGLFLSRNRNTIVEKCIFTGNGASGILSSFSDTLYLVDNLYFNTESIRLPDEFLNQSCLNIAFTSIFNFTSSAAGGLGIITNSDTKEILILRNNITNNSATPPVESTNIPDSFKPYGRGGGLSILVMGSVGCHICVKDSVVRGNRAQLAAGGISFTLSGNAINNSLIIDNSTVANNTCENRECIGGGIHVTDEGQGPSSSSNTLYMYDSTIEYNVAKGGTGGGLVGVILSDRSRYILSNCTFRGNVATHDGSGIVLLSVTGIANKGNDFSCWDCHFENNEGLGGIVDDVAALYAYHSSVSLYSSEGGATRFVNNTGGGVEVTLGLVVVRGLLEFKDNRAVLGGGMRLTNRARLYVHPDAEVRFVNNMAKDLGGGLYVRDSGEITVARNSFLVNDLADCFIQSYSPRSVEGFHSTQVSNSSLWDVRIIFQGNIGKLGESAIYIDDIEDCCLERDINDCKSFIFFTRNESNALQWPFIYRNANDFNITDSGNISSLIATDAYQIDTKFDSLQVAINEGINLEISTSDFFNRPRSTIVEVDTKVSCLSGSQKLNNNHGVVNSGEDGTASYRVNLSEKVFSNMYEARGGMGPCYETTTVELEFQNPDIVDSNHLTVTLNVSLCHIGYRYNNTTRMCECQQPESFHITCNQDARYFIVRDGLWVRFYNNNTQMEAWLVPQVYLNCTAEFTHFPNCEVQFDHPDAQCAEGRKGPLCGSCRDDEGYGIAMDLNYCVDCSGKHFSGYFLFMAVCLTVVVCCALILYFNIGVPNELRGFFFFVQVIGIVYSYRTFFVSKSKKLDYFGIVTNLFAVNLPFSVCIHPAITPLWMAVLGYVPPILAFSTVVVFAVCARYVSRFAKRSTLSGITFILLFVYMYLANPSVYLVNCSKSFQSAEIDNYLHRFTGQPCFRLPHVVWVAVALTIIGVFVIPVPVFIFIISCRHFKRTMHFSDALTSGLRRKWYSSWDLIRRLWFIVFGSFVPISIPARILALCLFEIFGVIVLCLSRPYEKKWINIAEGFMLADLFFATVAILQPYDLYVGRHLTGLLVMVPYLYAIPVALFLIGKYIWKNHVAAKWKERLEVFFSINNLKSTFRYKRFNNPQSEMDDDEDDDDPNKKFSIFYVSMDGNNLLDDQPVAMWGNRTREIPYRQELLISSSL